MKIVEPTYKIFWHLPEGYSRVEDFLEEVGRTCYQSYDKIKEGSSDKFVSMLMKRGHMAMLEHCVATVRFQADRGMSHEVVRHRIASFAQQSTRFCNFSKGKFDGEIKVIALPDSENPSDELKQHWEEHAKVCENAYMEALGLGAKPEIARMWLPIGLRTEIVMTANLREWHTVFGLRADEPAHPVIRKLARMVLTDFCERVPSMYKELKAMILPPDELNYDERELAVEIINREIAKLEKKKREIKSVYMECPF